MNCIDLSRVLQQFKQNWTKFLEASEIEQVCRKEGMLWRRRLLDPVRTIQLFILQVLHGNTACTYLPHLSQLQFTASAYCQARKRVSLGVLQALVKRIGAVIQEEYCADAKWRGHRTFLIDGSSFSMPDTLELQEYFGQPSGQRPGCGFPVAHMLALFNAKTGMIIQGLSSQLRSHDMTRTTELHSEFKDGDVLVADRGFCSYGHICLLLQGKIHCLMRVHATKIVNFRAGRAYANSNNPKKGRPTSRWIKKLGVKDQVVEWYKPNSRNWWMTPEQFVSLPNSILVRELRYRIITPGFRTQEIILVTTLLSEKEYPAQALAELYAIRWSIETNFRHLKTTMGMDVLRCETVEGVLKKLCVFCLVYNLVRFLMMEAAKQQNVSVDRVSFLDALRWLTMARYHPLPFKILVNPHRPNRVEPRAIKRRPKQYFLLRIPRQDKRAAVKYQ